MYWRRNKGESNAHNQGGTMFSDIQLLSQKRSERFIPIDLNKPLDLLPKAFGTATQSNIEKWTCNQKRYLLVMQLIDNVDLKKRTLLPLGRQVQIVITERIADISGGHSGRSGPHLVLITYREGC
jgi:hypothetical protein